MTKTRKVFLGVFAAIFVFALTFFFTACTTEYTLTFMDGETEIAKVVGAEGTSVEVPEEASKEGYELVGWYLYSDFSGSEVEIPSTMPAQNVTYYAKYAALRTITLNTDGGNYESDTVQLAEGSNLYDGIKDYEPSKTGLVFGAWYDENGDEVTSETLVPASDVTLTAKYKVVYTIEYYLQSEEDGSYAIDDSKTETGTDWEGTYCSPTVSVAGYELVDNENSVESLTLSATDKIFKFYFDIANYTVSYNANVPSGATVTGTVRDTATTYKGIVNLADCGYSIEGYRFLGWATTAAATSAQYAAGDAYSVTGNVIFYAVWDKGYSDFNGGSDYLFILDGENVLFVRAGAEFNGTYTVSNGLMLFTVYVGTYEIKGSILSDYTFVFYNSAEAGTYTYAASYGTTTDDGTLVLDGYYSATYSYTDEDGTKVELEGTYGVASSSTSTYYFSYTSGGFYFRLGTDGEGNNVFYTMGAEGYLGYIYYSYLYSLYATSGSYSYSAYGYYYGYYVYCDGFGTGVIVNETSETSYTYSYIAEDYTLAIEGEDYDTIQITFYSGDIEVYRIIVIPLSSFYAYFEYNSDVSGDITLADGSKLDLDGYAYNATYTLADKTELTGKYAYEESVLGGYYVTFVDESGAYEYKFYLDESGTLTLCTGDEGAYYYISDFYYAYDLVIYLDGKGNVTLYDASGSTIYKQTSGTPVQIATGTYVYDNESGTYTLTLDTSTYASGYTVYSQIVFTLYSDDVYEMVSSTVNSVTTSNFVTYYAADGTYMTVHGNGLFTYYDGANEFEGYVNTSGTNWYYGYYYDSTAGSYVYLTYNVYVNESGNNVLVMYDLIPRTSSYYSQYGSTDSTITLYLDGLGNAEYTNGTTVVSGTYTVLSDTEYTFTSTDGTTTFDFMLLMSSSTSGYTYYFAVYDETYNGTLTGTDNSTLAIDGYGFTATYTTADGTVYEGYYYFYDEDNDTIIFSSSALGYVVYFYLQEDATTYVVYDRYSGFYYSSTAEGDIDGVYYLYLDGEGGFYLLDYSTYYQYFYIYYYYYSYSYSYAVNYAMYYSLEAYGEYVVTDEDNNMLELVITEAIDDVYSALGSQVTIKVGGALYSIFYIYDSDYDLAFTAADGSVLALDGVGNAAYSTSKGEKSTGDYRIEQSVDGTDVIIMGSYAFAVDYDNMTFELYATLVGSYYDYLYYYYGYGSTVVWIWEMADGSQTLSIDLTDSYYAYAGYLEYLEDVDGNEITLWFVPFITYSSGYYMYLEYIYEYEYTNGSTTYTIHYDGLISLYYYVVVGSDYDVTYISEEKVGDYNLIKYVYLFGSFDSYAGTYAGYTYSIALADSEGNLLNNNYFYYNYLTGAVYFVAESTDDSATYIYFTENYSKVYQIVFSDSATTINEVTISTLADTTNAYTLYYVEYGSEVYLLYLTNGETTITVYSYWYINEAETYMLISAYDDDNNYYFLLDESGTGRQLLVAELITDITSADKKYELSYLVVCGEQLYYVEALSYGDYSILTSAAIGDTISANGNNTYTITFETDAATYTATLTYSEGTWSLSVAEMITEYTATEGDVEVKFNLTEAGDVQIISVTINGTDVTENYETDDDDSYELTIKNTVSVTNGTIISILFTTEGTLTYVTRYVLSSEGSEIGYYDYTSEGEVVQFVEAESYTVISSYVDDTTLTVYASYEYNNSTVYVNCAVILGTSTFTVTTLNTRNVTYTSEDNSNIVVITLLVDASGNAQEILSVIYDGSSVTDSVGSLIKTSDGKYVVTYSFFAYVVTLGETTTDDKAELYISSAYYSSGTLYLSSMYLVKFEYTYSSSLVIDELTGLYTYVDGMYVAVTVPSDYNVTSSTYTCTVTLTSDNVNYTMLFYYASNSTMSLALPVITATYTLEAANNSSVVLTYYTTESSTGLSLSYSTLTIGSTSYSYSSLTSLDEAGNVKLVIFTSGTSDVYLFVDLSGSDMVCYYVEYETVTVSGTYRFNVYYYVNGSELVVVLVDSTVSVYETMWNSVSTEFEEVENEDNTYTFTYGEKTYKVTFTYDTSSHTLAATVEEVVASAE